MITFYKDQVEKLKIGHNYELGKLKGQITAKKKFKLTF